MLNHYSKRGFVSFLKAGVCGALQFQQAYWVQRLSGRRHGQTTCTLHKNNIIHNKYFLTTKIFER